MGEWIHKKARTVEEAKRALLEELGASEDEVEIEVVEEPAKGLLGLLMGREAWVKGRLLEDKGKFAARFLQDITERMGVQATVEVEERDGDYIKVNIRGRNLGVLIGRRGDTLDALQYLVNIAASRAAKDGPGIIIDAEGYRRRRERSLRKLASRLSERVKRTGRRVVLEPMTPHERRVIHLALRDDPCVETHSEGEEPYRKVVISYRRKRHH